MSDIEVRGIAPERLAGMQAAGQDEFGNPWTLRVALGWEPLRCCLRVAGAGERIGLISYTPWTTPSPWAESGPVFVHYGQCDGYGTAGSWPEDLRGRHQLVRPYGPDGGIAYDHIRTIAPDDDPEAVVRELLAHPDVDHVHIRSATAGCFAFSVHSAD
jgi:Protein of unknown function (DUF1203)